jgi:hypothetical protein
LFTILINKNRPDFATLTSESCLSMVIKTLSGEFRTESRRARKSAPFMEA